MTMEKAPITDKGKQGKPNVRARWVAKEYKTHARPELYALTPPLEALKVALSEVATGACGRKVVALRLRSQHEEEYSSNCRQKITRQVMNTCAACCNTTCTTHATPAQNWGGGAGIHTQRSQVEETKDRVPTRVWRGCIKGKHIVTTVHGNPITIGGERSVVKFLIKMKTRKYETKKQVIGEDADVEKGGRILSLVVEWSLDRITIEADQRHVREIFKDLE